MPLSCILRTTWQPDGIQALLTASRVGFTHPETGISHNSVALPGLKWHNHSAHLQRRHEVVVTDDGQPEEAVEGADDEDDDAPISALLLCQPRRWKPLDGGPAAVELGWGHLDAWRTDHAGSTRGSDRGYQGARRKHPAVIPAGHTEALAANTDIEAYKFLCQCCKVHICKCTQNIHPDLFGNVLTS